MQYHFVPAVQPAPFPFPPGSAPLDAAPRQAVGAPQVSDRFFLAMLGGYRASGGLARAAEVVNRGEDGGRVDAERLARWRVDRSLLCFEWQALTWLPRFQFARAGLLPDPAVKVVLAELRTVFDEAETAQWFATPNSALAHRAPVELLGAAPMTVLRAARRDRFVVDG